MSVWVSVCVYAIEGFECSLHIVMQCAKKKKLAVLLCNEKERGRLRANENFHSP